MTNNPVLIIDALSLFSRHYVRNPAMSIHGHQAGGIIGFLNGLAFITEQLKPSVTYIVWEGGGSSRRRSLFPDYKQNRRPPKLNRYYEDDIPDSTENRVHQIGFLVELLKNVPVCQLFVDDCEADDVIGYLCRNTLKEKRKFIASSDRDFYQLLDEKTLIYSWSSKKYLGLDEVKAQFSIAPENFVLAKAIAGDPSDNIPGVKGAGFKTLAKRFDLLTKNVSINDILTICENSSSKSPKIYSHIYENADLIKRNWKLMYLDVSNLAAIQIKKIEAIVASHEPKKHKMQFMRMLIEEGLQAFDSHEFFSAFSSL